jgi:hypothetical protein
MAPCAAAYRSSAQELAQMGYVDNTVFWGYPPAVRRQRRWTR